jgi:hypothetical protein
MDTVCDTFSGCVAGLVTGIGADIAGSLGGVGSYLNKQCRILGNTCPRDMNDCDLYTRQLQLDFLDVWEELLRILMQYPQFPLHWEWILPH